MFLSVEFLEIAATLYHLGLFWEGTRCTLGYEQ